MRVNETSGNSDAQEQNYNAAMENFAEHPEFPIEDDKDLEQLLQSLGQKPLYRALVDTYGREAAIDGLAGFLTHDVARLQVDVLVPPEVSVPGRTQATT